MSDSDSEEEEADAEREAFEACFPPPVFEPIVRALNVPPTPESISAIRGWLMPYLEESFSGNVVKEHAVTKRRKELRRLRDALEVVSHASRKRQGAAASLRWTLGDLGDGIPEKFVATLQRLHHRVGEQLHELSAPARRGPKPKTTLRDFIPDLVWLYERMTGEEAKKPYWLDDSGIYGGDFYRFAVAIWGCVRECIPQLKAELPQSEGALAQELQDHWPNGDTTTG